MFPVYLLKFRFNKTIAKWIDTVNKYSLNILLKNHLRQVGH